MAGRKNSSNSGGLCCIQSSLIIFNVITLLGGVATLGIGAWLLHQSIVGGNATAAIDDVSKPDGFPYYNDEFYGVSILLVALGSLVTFISFLGCFGAFANSQCLLLSYLIAVTVILVLQLMVSVFAIVYRDPMNDNIKKELIQHMKNQYNQDGPYARAWDVVHENFQCCGVDGYIDWFDIQAWPGSDEVPDSCCRLPHNNTGCGKTDASHWYKKGCVGQIQARIFEQLHIVAGAILAVVFLQLYGIIASTLLFYHTKSVQPSNAQRTSTPYKAYAYERAGMM